MIAIGDKHGGGHGNAGAGLLNIYTSQTSGTIRVDGGDDDAF